MFPFATVWMNLEDISLTEISQEEKDIRYDFTYMWIIKKKMNKHNKTERVTDTEQTGCCHQERRKEIGKGD